MVFEFHFCRLDYFLNDLIKWEKGKQVINLQKKEKQSLKWISKSAYLQKRFDSQKCKKFANQKDDVYRTQINTLLISEFWGFFFWC